MRGVFTSRSGAPTRLSLPARVGLHLILLLFSGVMLAPFLVMVVVSLIPNSAFLARDFSPQNFSLQNYVRTFQAVPFGRYYFNSIVVSVSVTVLQILISSLAAFAFARLRFRGRDALFLFYLATLMIPFPVTLIPNFLIIKALGWYDTYWALIVPGLFSVFSTFLLRQYYRSIPLDFDEAARMDGASSLRIWAQIIIPLSGPVLATLAIFVFQGAWNDFLWPLVVTASERMRTIPVGLAAFVGQYSTAWDLLMAGSVIALLPVLVIYVLGQKWFVEGIALSGISGR
ncbi:MULTISPECIES: carbohydrate ABC transporter permease [Caldilinea]|jgi:multiple sugar transport system permease protein|uniref:Putative ABC transporter permease protein n=1 Tax=Caldilinea aerophila (strain DSM 14535 / JCM 11387 / NBRC 104270 / STL-6-O1) TaxID=926550 RepID=I0I9D8_CALAS|nr:MULTISPECIES: carbohydrate ABC transporter permease [Caldilinea]MBO9394350.1 carbohydrate ABC transporter permease [Caldilinea sp.]BAM01876.1 putative ABC transporter permease protein [Caldilinea aerophila DSM 14535 = NBRC 104270]GIV73215.1 MAG: sugar ABC transporter permease [Caldilinea sp.]